MCLSVCIAPSNRLRVHCVLWGSLGVLVTVKERGAAAGIIKNLFCGTYRRSSFDVRVSSNLSVTQ